MKPQALWRRQFGGARLRIIFINIAERFQNVTAGFWKAGRDLHELASSVTHAVGQQNRDAFGKRPVVERRVAGQRVGHLHRCCQPLGAMIQYITQVQARADCAGPDPYH